MTETPGSQPFLFEAPGTRRVVADFSGGTLSGDGGCLLLRVVDRGLGLTRHLAGCFTDTRDQRWVDHSVGQLLAQRLYALALGCEDLNDHGLLRRDPLPATACDKTDPLGRDRCLPQFRDAALAAPATLNRLEWSNHKRTRAHKLVHDPKKLEACLLELGARCLPRDATEPVLDPDAMGSLVHGPREGRFLSGYCDDYCYLPLYVFCGNTPLWAQLRTADQDAAAGSLAAVQRIVTALRRRNPRVRILLRADSGFARDELMAWCETQRQVYYCFGLAQNSLLADLLATPLADAAARHALCGGAPVRIFTEFACRTLDSWSRTRRVIGKAEVNAQGRNPRFLVTDLPRDGFGPEEVERFAPAALYEGFHCARGPMENVLKQQTLDLHADRLSTHHPGSNQLRLWLSTPAYLLLERVRAVGLAGTELAKATVVRCA